MPNCFRRVEKPVDNFQRLSYFAIVRSYDFENHNLLATFSCDFVTAQVRNVVFSLGTHCERR